MDVILPLMSIRNLRVRILVLVGKRRVITMIEYTCHDCNYAKLDIEIKPDACCPTCGTRLEVEEEIV
ncbi:hypothetical protein AW02_008460 [Bacillus velezensis NJN-6]|nr:hypothetical protein AW02_008460 [Bacillus velezensis NJN-6]